MDGNIEDRVTIMHQCAVIKTKSEGGYIDISLFYRFLKTEKEFVHRGHKVLFPLVFIEFTKQEA